MPKNDKHPPLLAGFTTRGAGKTKVLSSPTTSLWLAVIFAAIFFALMSVRHNIDKAEGSLLENQKGVKVSGFIVEAPPKVEELAPPPDPALLIPEKTEEPEWVSEEIQLLSASGKIELKPIDVEMPVRMPEEFRKAENVTVEN